MRILKLIANWGFVTFFILFHIRKLKAIYCKLQISVKSISNLYIRGRIYSRQNRYSKYYTWLNRFIAVRLQKVSVVIRSFLKADYISLNTAQ
jgi:hypothetical protein